MELVIGKLSRKGQAVGGGGEFGERGEGGYRMEGKQSPVYCKIIGGDDVDQISRRGQVNKEKEPWEVM